MEMKTPRNETSRWVLGLLLGLLAGGCDEKFADKPDGGADMSIECVKNPTKHVELINACTPAQSYDKKPFYPTLAPGGALPPLP